MTGAFKGLGQFDQALDAGGGAAHPVRHDHRIVGHRQKLGRFAHRVGSPPGAATTVSLGMTRGRGLSRWRLPEAFLRTARSTGSCGGVIAIL